ncbi:MAG: outer membrane lipoprotein-sorting protein, partial [Pseudomonadales bacterium]|nr:outer membrane lipoprotein-sorting protein [Pseudomonadales bacterium]
VGLYFAAYMPPFKYFGLFTAIGVAIAGVYSLVFLPAAMAIIKPNASKHMQRMAQSDVKDNFSRLMIKLGDITLNNSKTVVAIFAVITAIGLTAAVNLTVDEDRIETFHPSEPLYQADKAINHYLNGTNSLDIVIEAAEVEGLFEPENLNKMAALQEYALTLPNVQGATSIVDYLMQMNRSLNGGDKSEYKLPADKELIAQYFLIYSASSDPTDFEDEIDYDYRVANMRLKMNKGSFQDTKDTIHALEAYIAENFTTEDISATLSGRVTVNYHWIKDLGESHFVGLFISLFLVWAVASLLFGSVVAGVYAITPVGASILLVYAAMVLLEIPLGVGTSMFASVAIGLGVDFSIHSIDRLRESFKEHCGDWDKALAELYPLTGRALFFNYLAIALGFGVLTTSEVVPLTDFGTIVFISVTTSFFASMSLLPALIKILKPRFISEGIKQNNLEENEMTNTNKFARITSVIAAVGLIGFSVISTNIEASETTTPLTADAIVSKVNMVDDGEHVTRNMTMTMIDKRGKKRERETTAYRKYYDGEKRTILFYKKPSNVKGTAFLTFDYKDIAKDDDQWLYLPALRKVRRISASDRGDYFLGTDFTYEDIMLEGKLEVADYDFSIINEEKLTLESGESYDAILIKGMPKTKEIAKELGYSRSKFWVDTATWLIIKANYWGIKGKPLKTLTMTDISTVDGILTRHRLSIDNHKTGHHTTFKFSDVDYKSPVKDKLFTQRAMKQGK